VVACILMTVGPGMVLVQGAVVPAVMQAIVSPLQPIDVRSLERRFRPRLRAYLRAVAPILALFLLTGIWQYPAQALVRELRPFVRDSSTGVSVAAALATALLPNLPLFALFTQLFARAGSARSLQFLGAVAVVEGLPPKETAARSAQLAIGAGARRAARFVTVAIAFGGGVFGAMSFGVLARRMPPEVALGALAPLFALAFVLFGPFFAVLNALNYLLARRAIGEPLDKALADFERAVLPESHWKLAERERVATLIASRR
jgi:hypothetical protein